MNGKGSRRRPKAISDAEEAERWDAIFRRAPKRCARMFYGGRRCEREAAKDSSWCVVCRQEKLREGAA